MLLNTGANLRTVRRKLIYIVSDIDKALFFEWVTEHINQEKFELSFILLNPGPSHLETFLADKGIQVETIFCKGKMDWFKVTYKVFRILKKFRPDIIHCHLLQANIIGLTAGKMAGISKRVYTRHHSSFHHKYFPKGVWWDKLSNYLATHIIAISNIVKKVLIDLENVSPAKVSLIPHGFKLEEFRIVSESRVHSFKQRNNLAGKLCIGVISRFTELKGVQYIIPAFKRFLSEYPNSVLLMLNAYGDYEQHIHKLLHDLPAGSYQLIKFEHDIAAAYKAMDIFIHVPVDAEAEAFGQIYIEALAAGVPSIFTRSGIANDFGDKKDVAIWVNFRNEEEIYKGLALLARDSSIRKNLIESGRQFSKEFDLPVYIKNLEDLYLS